MASLNPPQNEMFTSILQIQRIVYYYPIAQDGIPFHYLYTVEMVVESFREHVYILIISYKLYHLYTSLSRISGYINKYIDRHYKQSIKYLTFMDFCFYLCYG